MSEGKPETPAMSYLSLYPILRRVARDHGYALALHGSLQRDMDLVAVPWRDEVSDPETLVRAMAEVTGLYFVNGWSGPHQLPGGRIGHKLTPGGDLYLDISILPSTTAAERRGAERGVRERIAAMSVGDCKVLESRILRINADLPYIASEEGFAARIRAAVLAALFPEGGR